MKALLLLSSFLLPLFLFAQETAKPANPANLDLSQPQVFLDTTRTSVFYQQLIDWEPDHQIEALIDEILAEIGHQSSTPQNFTGYPTELIQVRRLNGKFVLYDPCDGGPTRFSIQNGAFITYGTHEPTADVIYRTLPSKTNAMKVELRTLLYRSPSQKALLFLRPTRTEHVYVLSVQADGKVQQTVVIPVDKIPEFDLVVNHCPINKRSEWNGFDPINFQEVK